MGEKEMLNLRFLNVAGSGRRYIIITVCFYFDLELNARNMDVDAVSADARQLAQSHIWQHADICMGRFFFAVEHDI